MGCHQTNKNNLIIRVRFNQFFSCWCKVDLTLPLVISSLVYDRNGLIRNKENGLIRNKEKKRFLHFDMFIEVSEISVANITLPILVCHLTSMANLTYKPKFINAIHFI